MIRFGVGQRTEVGFLLSARDLQKIKHGTGVLRAAVAAVGDWTLDPIGWSTDQDWIVIAPRWRGKRKGVAPAFDYQEFHRVLLVGEQLAQAGETTVNATLKESFARKLTNESQLPKASLLSIANKLARTRIMVLQFPGVEALLLRGTAKATKAPEEPIAEFHEVDQSARQVFVVVAPNKQVIVDDCDEEVAPGVAVLFDNLEEVDGRVILAEDCEVIPDDNGPLFVGQP